MVFAHQVHSAPHMRLHEYEKQAIGTNKLGDLPNSKDQLRFGFFGEIGGLLALVKKSQRDNLPAADHNNITEEIGDALWYLTNVAATYGTTLQDVGVEAMLDLQRRMHFSNTPSGELTFEQFDGVLALCREQLIDEKISEVLRELAAFTGQLVSVDPKSMDLLSDPPQKLLGRLLSCLVTTAGLFHQKIASIAESNIRKIESRWPRGKAEHIPLFDANRTELEQFPRQFSMHFIERRPQAGGNPYVIQRLNGVNIGDRLTDNRSTPDGYRFHDVFHLAYLTHLGWSPVIRALLKLKRKSDPNIDENEDGARAIIIEEGIATWIFNHAQSREYFKGVEIGRLDYGLLKQVVAMVNGYEVASCPLWQWELAILDGFKIFRALKDSESGCGIVHVNLRERTLKIEPIDALPEVVQPRARQIPVGTYLPTGEDEVTT